MQTYDNEIEFTMNFGMNAGFRSNVLRKEELQENTARYVNSAERRSSKFSVECNTHQIKLTYVGFRAHVKIASRK